MVYKVNSNSNRCLFSELPSASVRVRHSRVAAEARPLELEVSRCRTSQLQGVSCRLRFVCVMTFPTLCLSSERLMGLRKQSIVGCFPEFVCSVFRGAGAWGVAYAIYVFPLGPVLLFLK